MYQAVAYFRCFKEVVRISLSSSPKKTDCLYLPLPFSFMMRIKVVFINWQEKRQSSGTLFSPRNNVDPTGLLLAWVAFPSPSPAFRFLQMSSSVSLVFLSLFSFFRAPSSRHRLPHLPWLQESGSGTNERVPLLARGFMCWASSAPHLLRSYPSSVSSFLFNVNSSTQPPKITEKMD